MELALAIVRYVFVGTVLIGGGVVMWSIVRLAWDKARTQTTVEDDA
jgi:hypothetical protein